MSKDISTMYSKEREKTCGRRGYAGWQAEKELDTMVNLLIRKGEKDMNKKKDAVTEELFLIPCRNSGRNMMKSTLNNIFGIGGYNMNTNYSDMYKNGSLFGTNGLHIKNVIFNEPATIVIWDNGDKTVVKCKKGEKFDREKGLAMAISKKALGNRGNYFNEFKKWMPKETTDAAEYISLKDFAASKATKGGKDK